MAPNDDEGGQSPRRDRVRRARPVGDPCIGRGHDVRPTRRDAHLEGPVRASGRGRHDRAVDVAAVNLDIP